MANINPVEHLADILVTAAVGARAAQSGWGIFVGKAPVKPDSVITLYNTGGLNPNPKWLLDFPSIQTIVRGNINGGAGTYDKAREVRDTLLGCDPRTINGERLVSVLMISDIATLGFDDNNREMLSVNFSLIVEPASGLNRDPL